jgi:23S rRNA (uracil1939-C5)-methyltransferase
MILRPEAPAHGGAVVARDEGRVLLVYYALPGEVVEAEPAGRQGGMAAARTARVLEPAPGRVDPPCPHFGACGGCQWQHAAYDLQLDMKRSVVEQAWARVGLRLPPDTPMLGMTDPWRYRIRGDFEVVELEGISRLGLHRLRSHRVLPIQTCPIHDLRIERALRAFEQALGEHRVPDLQGLVLTVEPTGNGLLVGARLKGAPPGRLPEGVMTRAAALVPELVLLDDSMTLEFWDLTFRVRSDTFVQTNYRQMLVLYQVALEMLAPSGDEAVLDLYSGIGTISLVVARRARSVTAVEENPRALALARVNARINAAGSVRLLAGRVETVLRQVRLGEHQAAVLDPPRAGCHPAAIAELLRLGPERIVYISCEPSTHARDLGLLVRGGYRVRRAAIVDMFPQTYHIESVALLERSHF